MLQAYANIARGTLLGAQRLHAISRGNTCRTYALFTNYGLHESRPLPKQLAFDDHESIYEGWTTRDLLRAWVVLKLCGMPALVRNSESVLKQCRSLLGENTTNRMIESTFYKHFCAGESAADVWAKMNSFRAAGVGAIIDFAEEEDVLPHTDPDPKVRQMAINQDAAPKASSVSAATLLGGESVIESAVTARTFLHTGSPGECDRHLKAFMNAVDTAANLPGQGFAAIKLSALTAPRLLERLSQSINRVHSLFSVLDLDGDGVVTREEFAQNASLLMGDMASIDERDEMFQYLDFRNEGKVDYLTWVSRLDVRTIPNMANNVEASIGNSKPKGLAEGSLTPEERGQLDRMYGRLDKLLERAMDKGVKVMIDAEHTIFNPAIDHVATQLMRKYNRESATVYSTYQAYLRNAVSRLQADLQRAEVEGYRLGAKLVRGAYLKLERKHASDLGLASPVFDHMAETTSSINTCMDMIVRAVKEEKAELMLGSHNQASVERLVACMSQAELDHETSPVFFGQLMGMADNLSFTLGNHCFRVLKYVPYGRVDKVVPYLLRRANETQYALMGGKQDIALLQRELWRRLTTSSSSSRSVTRSGGSSRGSAVASR